MTHEGAALNREHILCSILGQVLDRKICASCPEQRGFSVQQTQQTMLEMQSVLRTVERELPDTAAAVRLSGLELSDAIEEVSLLRCAPGHPLAPTGILLSHMTTMLHMSDS